jgi:hypothetical protein
LHLSLKAITFTKLSYFLKKGFVPFDESKKVRFCLDCGQLYKAPKDAPLDDIYVLRKKNNNAQIPFLDFGNRTYFEKSKLGMLDSVLRIFDERYKDVCQIEFENLETAAVCNDVANPKGKENPKWLAQLGKMFDGKTIGIKNYAEEPLDAAIAMLASKVERRSGASVVIGETGDACIKIVESREFYEAHPDIKDPYGVDEGVAVQHITKETLLDDAEGTYSCADVFIKEMAIKRDIKNQFMGTLDWPSFGLKGSWVFYRFVRRHKKDESDEYWRLEISEEGKLSFSNVLDENSFEWEYAGELEKVNDGNCNYAVIASDGSINRIYEEYDTGVALFAVPDFKTIGDKLRRGETISRSADGRAAYLQESIDVAYAPIDERSAYFYSGVIGKGMQSSLARAALLRRIVAVGESRLLIDELLPLMDVDIVRLRNTTVIPFPFKYLREYCASLTPKSN